MAVDVDGVERETIEYLDGLCRLPSVSAEGRALAETADYVESLLADSGFTTCQLHADASLPPSGASCAARATGRCFSITTTTSSPSIRSSSGNRRRSSRRCDGKVFARGAADNNARIARHADLLQADGCLWEGESLLSDGRPAAHAPNEHIRLEDIAPAVRDLNALLEELGTQ